MIDDQFPTYDKLVQYHLTDTRDSPSTNDISAIGNISNSDEEIGDQSATPPATNDLDVKRAASLWRAFRANGWNCDIDDGAGIQVQNHRFGESDLTILDYELSHDDPEPALDLLRSLSRSDHASLAVVYTSNSDLSLVRLMVAARLRGYDESRLNATPVEVSDAVESLDEPSKIDSTVVLDALQRKTSDVMGSTFGRAIIALKTQRGFSQSCSELVQMEVERFLRDSLNAPSAEAELPQPFAIDKSANNDGPLWVLCHNLFVAFVAKHDVEGSDGTEEGDRVIGELKRALESWEPDGLTLTLSFSRGLIARSGFKAAADALNDSLRNACFLYLANKGDEDEKTARVKQFYNRLLSSFAEKILDEVSEFGRDAIRSPETGVSSDNRELAKWALQLSGDRTQEQDMFHELNMFLSTESPKEYAKLGTVFSVQNGENCEYWMCATPACDMVPRAPNVKKWEGQLDPIRPVIFIKGEVSTNLTNALDRAEQGKAIFVTFDEESNKKRGVLRFIPDKGTPFLEHFFLSERGKIHNQHVAGHRSKLENDNLTLESVSLRVVAQVRELYANRLLRYVGEHVSRIGVDFVRLSTSDNPDEI